MNNNKKLLLNRSIAPVNPFEVNLVAYWKLDSNSNDSTINAHNGTDTNINYANPGIVNNCATFNGTSSKIIVPSSTDFNFSDVVSDIPFTINMLTKFSGTSDYSLINRYDASNNSTFEMQTFGGKVLMLFFSNASTYIGAQTVASVSVGPFQQITTTYDGSGLWTGIKIYFNGILQTTTSFNNGSYTKMPISSLNLAIGTYLSGGGFFNGELDEIAIWKNRELNPTEVLDAYNKLLTGQSLI